MGNSITDSETTFVWILNATNKNAIVQFNTLKVKPLGNYDIVKTTQN